MSIHRSLVPARRALRRSRILQMLVLTGFWLVGEAVVRLSGLPVPGGIVGLALVLALLASGRIEGASMRRGAQWFLAEMLLFFVPAVLAILDHRELLGLVGVKILAVILVGTVTVMGSTALAVDLCHRWRDRHGLAGRDRHVLG